MRDAEAIESMGMLDAIHRRWSVKQREFLRLQAQASDAAGCYQAASRFVQQVLGSLLLGLGASEAMPNPFLAPDRQRLFFTDWDEDGFAQVCSIDVSDLTQVLPR